MSKPAFLFDGRNILDHAALQKIGFEASASVLSTRLMCLLQVYAIGKPYGSSPVSME